MVIKKTFLFIFLVSSFVFSTSYNWQNAPSYEEKPILKFALITDTHCTCQGEFKKEPKHIIQIGPYRVHWKNSYYSFSIVEKTIKYIGSNVKPDFIIHCGDITEYGKKEDMEEVKKILDNSIIPYYVVMGDHDVVGKNNFKDVFGEKYYSFDFNNWHFIIIGIFPSDEEISYLKNDLKENSQKPTIIATHRLLICDRFTKFLVKNFTHNTPLLMPKANEILSIIKEFPQVKIVLSGHIHSNLHYKENNIHFISTSSLIEPPYQFRNFVVYKDKIFVQTYISKNINSLLNGEWDVFNEEIIYLK